MSLFLHPDHLATIRGHGLRDYPDECCGVLLGRRGDDGDRVVEVCEVPNAHPGERRRRFLVGPQDYLHAEREAHRRGLELLGFYHSHPDHPAQPSELDRRHAWPNLHYVIVEVIAGHPGELRSFLLANDRSTLGEETLGLDPAAATLQGDQTHA